MDELALLDASHHKIMARCHVDAIPTLAQDNMPMQVTG
jgi:hypothetical protein